MKPISFNGVAQQAKKYHAELQQKFSEIIDRGIFLNGPEEAAFIQRWTQYFGNQGEKHWVTTTSSGHDALLLALQALHLKKTDEVIFPVNAYPTAFPLALSGTKLVAVDVDRNGLISISEIEKHLTDKTKVIVVVHLYGLVVDVAKIQKLIAGRNIVLIEDCAQSLGSKYKGKLTGSLADIGCFSFYPTKNVGTLGDGGALLTPHQDIFEFFSAAKAYGEKERYKSEFVSGHSRLAELQAGALNVCLAHFRTEKKKRQHNVELYQQEFQKQQLKPFIYHNSQSEPVLHLLVMRTKKRSELQSYLSAKHIPTAIHYPVPIHLLPAFYFLNRKLGDFPQAEQLAQEIISLPFHAYLTKNQIKYIVQTIREFYDQ